MRNDMNIKETMDDDNLISTKARYVSVAEFYAGKTVFVTGGTGFMGKVLLFKLLKCCPDIKCIYVLMRPKRGDNVQARLCKLISGFVFSKLRNPVVLNKIIPINGDIAQPRLGINESDQEILIENVSVVFHLAATVKFDETLKDSVTINVLGTQRLIELCRDMVKLEAVIHVSTAYSNCDRHDVTEVIYPPPFSPEKVMQFVEWMDNELLNVLTPKLLGKHPNTYTFTKALAEDVILTSRGSIPFSIIRPSVVLSSLTDPQPGWVDNWNGPNKIIGCFGRGTFRSVQLHGEKLLDIIPVDLVVNVMICSAWHTALVKPRCVTVYNCCSGQLNPINWKTFVDNCLKAIHKYPSMHMILRPHVTYYRNKYANYVSDFFLHMLPAILSDFFVATVFKWPSYRYRLHRKFCKELQKLQYFAVNEWQFYDNNMRLLSSMLNTADKNEFTFDVSNIDWQKYIDLYVLGIRTFVLKEHINSILRARSRQQKIQLLERIFKITGITSIMVATAVFVWTQKTPSWRYSFLKFIFVIIRIINKVYIKTLSM